MEERIKPQILYTEDEPGWSNRTQEIFTALGVDFVCFTSNEEARSYCIGSEGQIFDGAVVDYYTYSSLNGVELITDLLKSQACGEVLVLSSTTARYTLISELTEACCEEKVEIFDKYCEYVFAALYVAIRTYNPDVRVTRLGILKAAGIGLRFNGEVADTEEAYQKNNEIRRHILRGEFNIENFKQQAVKLSI